jgi:ribosome assembly protein 1
VNPRDVKNSDPKIAIKSIFSQWLPLEKRILEMIIKHVPPPNQISEAKAEMLMCASIDNFKTYPLETQQLKTEFTKCDRKSDNVIVFISKVSILVN